MYFGDVLDGGEPVMTVGDNCKGGHPYAMRRVLMTGASDSSFEGRMHCSPYFDSILPACQSDW